jgi:hypothetical protein
VAAGAGSGKTTLLKKLARTYAKDNFPVLRVSALAVARRMNSAGEGFTTAAFTVGLDGSGLPLQTVRAAGLGDWVLLCDGLDKCGAQQEAVAEGLLQFVAGQPRARVIVTTRTIGYRTAALAAWRHYDLPFFVSNSVRESMTVLLRHILPPGKPQSNLSRRVKDALEDSGAGGAAAPAGRRLGTRECSSTGRSSRSWRRSSPHAQGRRLQRQLCWVGFWMSSDGRCSMTRRFERTPPCRPAPTSCRRS